MGGRLKHREFMEQGVDSRQVLFSDFSDGDLHGTKDRKLRDAMCVTVGV